jgi:hypothetical protein
VQRSFADANNSPAGPKKAQFEERLANWDTRLATPDGSCNRTVLCTVDRCENR